MSAFDPRRTSPKIAVRLALTSRQLRRGSDSSIGNLVKLIG